MKVLSTLSFLFCAFVFKDALCRSHKHQHKSNSVRIVGGYDTDIERFPHQAYLFIEKGERSSECGGSILNEHTVLTAAHCLTGATEVYVRTGSTYLAGEDGVSSISYNYTSHPKYNPKTYDYDVAIVRPEVPIVIDGKKTKATQLPDVGSTIDTGTTVVVSGWGTTSENGTSSDNLRAVEIVTVSNDQCRKSYRQLTERMFCAGVPEGGKDSCQGDSGGPVVARDSGIQIGTVSFGKGCGRKNYPGVYVRLASASIRDWIKKESGV